MKYISLLFLSAILFLVSYYTIVLLLTPAPIEAEYWVKEMITIKVDIAKRYSNKHKIIIVGGSSTLFGVDTKKLTEDFNVPVINLGLHAGLSLEKLLDVAGEVATDGDTLILPLEISKYNEDSITSWQAMNLIAWEPEEWSKLSLVKRIEAITAIGPKIFGELILPRIQLKPNSKVLEDRAFAQKDRQVLAKFNPNIEIKEFAYSAYNLDLFGDMRKTEGANFRGVARDSPEDDIEISEASHETLLRFVATMSHKGIGVYFANTPYLKYKQFNMESVRKSSEKFRADLAAIAPIIDNKQDLIFDRKYFFNTPLHLNNEGRIINTERFKRAIVSNVSFR